MMSVMLICTSWLLGDLVFPCVNLEKEIKEANKSKFDHVLYKIVFVTRLVYSSLVFSKLF